MTTILARRTGNVLTRIWDGQAAAVERRREAEGPGWEPTRQPVPGRVAERPGSPELAAWVQRAPADSVKPRTASTPPTGVTLT